MVRTRVGYAGGTLEKPTYLNLGDHTETLQIDFDPQLISYEALLDIFWDSHDPTVGAYSTQYQSMILTHNEGQFRLATQSRDQQQTDSSRTIRTIIKPIDQFYLAEIYHQKYYLQGRAELMALLREAYPDGNEWVHSTAAARLNGIAGNNTSWEELDLDLSIMKP